MDKSALFLLQSVIYITIVTGVGSYVVFTAWTLEGAIPKSLLKMTNQEAAFCLGSLSTVPLAVMILCVMFIRMFLSGSDPLARDESRFLTVIKNVLQNTLEQTFPFVMNLWGAASWGTLSNERLIICTGIFLLSRMSFWVTYHLADLFSFHSLKSPPFFIGILNTVYLAVLNLTNLLQLN